MTDTSKQGKNRHPFLTDRITQNVGGFSLDCLDIGKQSKQPEQLSESGASDRWEPDQVGNIRVGDVVKLPDLDVLFEVVALHGAQVVIRAPSGHEVWAAWRSVKRVRRRRGR